MADKIYDVYHQEIELTSEQEACLKYTGNRTLMVKGYAGACTDGACSEVSGKVWQGCKK